MENHLKPVAGWWKLASDKALTWLLRIVLHCSTLVACASLFVLYQMSLFMFWPNGQKQVESHLKPDLT